MKNPKRRDGVQHKVIEPKEGRSEKVFANKSGDKVKMLVRKAFAAPVTITDGGSTRQVPSERAMIEKLVRQAMGGKNRDAMAKVMSCLTDTIVPRSRRIKQKVHEQRVEQRAIEIFRDRTEAKHLELHERHTERLDGMKRIRARLFADGYRNVHGELGDPDFHDRTETMTLGQFWASLLPYDEEGDSCDDEIRP